MIPLLRCLILIHVICHYLVAVSGSGKVKPTKAPEPELRNTLRLGVFVFVDPNIANGTEASEENYTTYAAALLSGVNLKLYNIKNYTIKLGLLGVQEVPTQNFTDGYGFLDFERTWGGLEHLKGQYSDAQAADIVYLLTAHPMNSTSDPPHRVQGVATPKGACTEDNVAIGNDVLWTYSGMDIFTKNMAELMGAVVPQCGWNPKDAFNDCHVKHVLSYLRRAWPYCNQHTSLSEWKGINAMAGDGFNKTKFCQVKLGLTANGKCKAVNTSQHNTSCDIQCCSGEGEPKAVVYDSPDGVLCRPSKYQSEQGSCLGKNCLRRVALLRIASPGMDRHTNPDWSAHPTHAPVVRRPQKRTSLVQSR